MQEHTKSMLLELAALLDELPEGRFDYDTWVGLNWGGNPDLSCGTTACAAGWATTLPSFRERGLGLISLRGLGEVVINKSSKFGIHAMAEALDISYREAEALFVPEILDLELDVWSPDRRASAKDVATHIRGWVAAKTASEAKQPHENV